MAWDAKDLKCTVEEKGKISAVLAGIEGFDANAVPWKQVGEFYFFIPEAISGSNGVPMAVLALAKAALLLP